MSQTSVENRQRAPLLFLLVKWYGYVLAGMFLLYGGVQMILGVLDRTYARFDEYFFFLVLGGIIAGVVTAFRDGRPWGWIGLVVLNFLVLLLGVFHLNSWEQVVLLVLSAGALGALYTRPVRSRIGIKIATK